MSTKMKACSALEPLLEDRIDGKLSGKEAALVDRHLAECAQCRASMRDATEGSLLLKELADRSAWQATPAPGFARLAMARIRVSGAEQAAERESFWQSFVFFGWRFVATAALALALLGVYDAGWARNLQPTIAQARPTVVRDIVSSDMGVVPATRDDVLVMVAGLDGGENQ